MEAAPKRAKAASKKTAEVQKERVLSDFGAKKKNGKVGIVCEAALRLGARARLIVTIHRNLIIIKTLHITPLFVSTLSPSRPESVRVPFSPSPSPTSSSSLCRLFDSGLRWVGWTRTL